MFVRMRRLAGAGALGALAIKSALLTMNDDWDDLAYSVRKVLSPPPTKKPRVVILGSGWGALSFLRKLDQEALDITLISPRSFFFYTPLLAGTATGTVAQSSIIEPVRWYFDRVGHGCATYLQASCTAIDPQANQLMCALPSSTHSIPVDYDYLVIAVGAEPATFNIPGVKEHARFLKEVEDSTAIQRELLQNVELASALHATAASAPPSALPGIEEEVSRLLSWVVIGGGPTGVELSAELADFARAEVARYYPALAPRVKITLLEATDRILGVFNPTLAAAAEQALTSLGARVQTGTAVTRITPNEVHFKSTAKRSGDGSGSSGAAGVLPHGLCVWAGGIARRPIVELFARNLDPQGKLQVSRHGLLVDEFFRVRGVGDRSVFALGDCAVSGCAPTAQAAVQQGRYLGRAFRDALGALGEEAPQGLEKFSFESRGALAYTGGGTGVAELKLWDAHPGKKEGGSKPALVEGTPAFAIWRSLYFSNIMSFSNMIRVSSDWMKAWAFGRDISTPFVAGEAKRPPQAATEK
jgi:NADH:ubiquinone reductase (non-electrogenic)